MGVRRSDHRQHGLRYRGRIAAIGLAVAFCAALAGCGSEESPGPATEVTGIEWTTFQGMAIPTGDQGPRTTDAVTPTGYDRSPAGAVLAAVSATVRMSVADDSQWPSVGQKLIAPGTERDQWAISRAQVSITDPVKHGQAPTVLAYALGENSDQQVTVKIYSRLSDHSHTENAATVAWMSGDWRLSLPAGEKPAVRAVRGVPSLSLIHISEPTRPY